MEVPVKVAPEETDVPTTSASEPPKPAVAAPVMDVRPPQAEAAPAASAPAAPQPAATETPAPPTTPVPAPETTPPEEAKKPEKDKKEKPPKPVVPKKPRQPGVAMAIFASMVIVLGLAALATYAYLKTR